MQTRDVQLYSGIPLGDRFIKMVTLREGIVADTLNARDANKDGSELEFGMRVLAQRVKCVDDVKGAMDMDLMRNMTETDYQILCEAMTAFDEECEQEAREALGLVGGRSETDDTPGSASERS